jgi:hypothetical protein
VPTIARAICARDLGSAQLVKPDVLVLSHQAPWPSFSNPEIQKTDNSIANSHV